MNLIGVFRNFNRKKSPVSPGGKRLPPIETMEQDKSASVRWSPCGCLAYPQLERRREGGRGHRDRLAYEGMTDR